MEELEEKYIELLLKRCINFNRSKALFISYGIECEFVDKVVQKAKEMGIVDIYLYHDSLERKHEILQSISLDEIDNHPFFNLKIWDEYALKGASFLILETEIPGFMDDIDPKKLSRSHYIERATRPMYDKLQMLFQIPWCIATIPNKIWAKNVFPNDSYEEAYHKLFKSICSMCMIDTNNPIKSWNLFLENQQRIVQKLNSLQISKMHYRNSIGTDIVVELDRDAIWASAGSLGTDMIVNMPTYEVFTTPVFYKTNGIVYSSKPLMYNGGLIDKFYLVFQDGKVIRFGAKTGEDLLKGIIESDEYSSYLGEIALIDYNSPISNTGLVYGNTLIDENSSCHMALGGGFEECMKDGSTLSPDELLKKGVNPSKNHVDFMIGTSDLNIEADTKKGKVLILKNGNINI